MQKANNRITVRRNEWLDGIRKRLTTDVGAYIELIEYRASKGEFIGFWALARMIFPVIEEVARIAYPNSESGKYELLKLFGVEYSRIAWIIYRNSLLHGDTIKSARSGDLKVKWSLGIIGSGHFVKSGVMHIDLKSLYTSLINYLEREVQITGADSDIKIINEFEVDNGPALLELQIMAQEKLL